jgi:hypothetical protein
MRRRYLPRCAAAIALAALAASGCQRISPASPSAGVEGPAATDAGASVYEAELVYCVDEINRYRATVGLAALIRSSALEEFSATVARHDATVREAHAYFRSTNGAGVARAETEILWWKNQSIQQVIKKGLAQMWQVGPGGTHYGVLSGAYTEVGCGIFVADGEVTVAQDFR